MTKTVLELNDGRTWCGQLPDEVRDYLRETFDELDRTRGQVATLETRLATVRAAIEVAQLIENNRYEAERVRQDLLDVCDGLEVTL